MEPSINSGVRMTLSRKTPLARTGFKRTTAAKKAPAPRAKMKSKQRAVTAAEKIVWSKLAALGCIACMKDGNYNPHVSIHHVDGRTKPGCHMLVLPLCAGHHQDGTGEDKTMISVHPWKAQFVLVYGNELDLVAECMKLIGEKV